MNTENMRWSKEPKITMLTRVTSARAEGENAVAWDQDNGWRAVPLQLSHRILPTGEAVAGIGGELDIATAEIVVRYVKKIIDRHHGPVIADLTALRFCDAQGPSALLRMASYAEQAGYPFRLASPGPVLVKLMRITSLDHKFLFSLRTGRRLIAARTTPGEPRDTTTTRWQ
jgi:anti-sigma B factor antagonist